MEKDGMMVGQFVVPGERAWPSFRAQKIVDKLF
jgi:hypothetical protein